MAELSQVNKLIDIPELNKFKIGDEVVCPASGEFDHFEGVIIGIELKRTYGTNTFMPCITLLHDGCVTDEFRPSDLIPATRQSGKGE